MNGLGTGVLKGLGVTLRHFFATYVDDIRYAGRKYFRQDNFAARQGLDAAGAYTVQYPEEKLAVPERFRFIPFLVVNDSDAEINPGDDWCTSCGICAKVCPPQCIWIVRGEDPNTGRPIPQPEAFYIDIDICMNCGYCAEFCPFDAIKMDHDYELASYDRTGAHIHDKERLSKPFSYWRAIAPTRAAEEAEARGGWEHKDVLKEKAKRADAERKAAEAAAAAAAQAATPEAVAEVEVAAAGLSAEERKAKREAALARKRGEAPAEAAAPAPAAPEAPAELSAEERKAKRDAALARKRDRGQGGGA